MRLFAAVTPPLGAREELRRQVSAAASGGPERLRWTDPDDWHVTLAFYGEVPEERVAELCTRLGRAAHRHPPLELRVRGAGRFGDRVLWAGVTGDRPAPERLRRLADAAKAAGRRAGAPADDGHRYHPHLTLARARGDVHLAPLVERLADFGGATWAATELQLIRSTLPRSGVPGERPRHELLESWPLTG
ncbi:RNA 2',3'-cyclic phosphodiesterase [Streptomyces alkaliterrae]|uniref:RNA 2',3'-cyclic phosphodiesterase n=1 Tax=Streptomyces alkaliterrae TaxID=2213162 RepID=A0A5P0YNU2_9ACTN|nr:RNA 2',3'-cyclic phosphodiesterase [Streptomyces alkaliterrae]MBB1253677.1 RNA 2',3'-cyclic phosphodiesterase [Streptomyces alkaliterrae]MBB1260307.1 RNA 2',3'-cyclic phosphodiesterase [Streptomyces alkaliterrae]MQS01986.1 RNA 2',3'-cyclic phosphodiesterase [Streptomyces alkaliterrae]